MNALHERWNRISLRTKITGVTVLMLTFGLLVSGVGTLSMLRSWVLDQSDQRLIALSQGNLGEYLDIPSPTNEDAFVALYTADGQIDRVNWENSSVEVPVIPSTLTSQAALANGSKIVVLRSADGKAEFRAVTVVVTVQGSTAFMPVIVAISMVNAEKLLTAYLAIYLGLGLGVVILGGVLTRMLVTSTFAPLRKVEETAAQIAQGDFSQRMDVDTPNTEVGRLNRSLNTMLNRIDRALRDRAHTIDQMRRFVGDASHELRTPLVSVRGYAELYRMGALQNPDDVAGAMERIEKEAIRMSGLVEDMLELARLDEARPLELTPVDLVPLARDAVFDANAAQPDRSITLVAPLALGGGGTSSESASVTPRDAAPPITQSRSSVANLTGPIALAGAAFARLRPRRRVGAPPPSSATHALGSNRPELGTASADNPTELREHPFAEGAAVVLGQENRLRQIVTNLVANAMRYTPDGSPIEIRVAILPDTKQAELSVVDHGEGIPPVVREKIFQRFWRADTSRARETGGSGLGLAIVASLVAAHHGTVDVVETPGGGATFRVRLPLAAARAS
ncbi:MAG: sensor histidine kinase [Agromyces sp.]